MRRISRTNWRELPFPVFLNGPPGSESLLTYTQFLRGEDYFAEWLPRTIAVGDNGTGTTWFMLREEGDQLVRWDAEWEEYEEGDGPFSTR